MMKDNCSANYKYEKIDIFHSQYEVNLKGVLEFEVRSFLGRTFKNRRPALHDSVNFLNLGSGSRIIEDKFWVNADFYRFRKAPDFNFWGLDLRYPMKCPDAVWDGVFTEHTLEHLYPREVRNLLKELHRTMKTGAFIRIIVPNLAPYLEFSSRSREESRMGQFNSQCEAIRTLTQDYYHRSLWNADLFLSELSEQDLWKLAKPLLEKVRW